MELKSNQEAEAPKNFKQTIGKVAFKSKEIIVAIIIVLSNVASKVYGFSFEWLADIIVDLDWADWAPSLVATLLATIRYLFTSEPIKYDRFKTFILKLVGSKD